LLAYDVGHGPADAGLEGGGIRRVPGVQCLQHRGQVRGTGQASGVCRQDAFRAALHRADLLLRYFTDARKPPSALLKASGCSLWARSAAFGRISRREPSMRSCMTFDAATGVPGSSSPTMTTVGILMALILSVRSSAEIA